LGSKDSTQRSHSRDSQASSKFAVNENGLARFWLFEAVSMDGCGDIDVRGLEHGHGDCFSERDQMDH
jgi:hypothetical protein